MALWCHQKWEKLEAVLRCDLGIREAVQEAVGMETGPWACKAAKLNGQVDFGFWVRLELLPGALHCGFAILSGLKSGRAHILVLRSAYCIQGNWKEIGWAWRSSHLHLKRVWVVAEMFHCGHYCSAAPCAGWDRCKWIPELLSLHSVCSVETWIVMGVFYIHEKSKLPAIQNAQLQCEWINCVCPSIPGSKTFPPSSSPKSCTEIKDGVYSISGRFQFAQRCTEPQESCSSTEFCCWDSRDSLSLEVP